MEPSSDFKWPDDPPGDWWEATGAALGLKPEHVRFAAVMWQLGPDSKANSLAARQSGVEGGPSQAFRVARSIGVRKLLAKAKEIEIGRRPPITEQEIDASVEDLIRSPDSRAKQVGIELYHKRQDRSARSRSDGLPSDPAEIVRELLAVMGIEGTVSAAEMWFTATNDLPSCPHFSLIGPILCRRYPDLWRRYREPLASRAEFFKSDREQGFLDRFDACGALPQPSAAEFAAAVGKAAVRRGNGAAPPEPTDQAEASANAAA
jgi:hypothetical protein